MTVWVHAEKIYDTGFLLFNSEKYYNDLKLL